MKGTKFPILTTKLYIPPLCPNLVSRTHLIDRLNRLPGRRFTLISAPAGFGKTTFLSEWIAQSNLPAAWISLDENDSDIIHFLHYLVAALQGIEVTISPATCTVLESAQQVPAESVLTNLINDIASIQKEFVLVLDDYHLLESELVHQSVEFLINHLPSNIHFIIVSRADPPLPLAKLRAQDQLAEFRAADLCFSIAEATTFFNGLMNMRFSSHVISLLQQRTEGWIVGLQLAALSMQGRDDIPSFIKHFAGDDRHIVDYLAEEVLNLQPAAVQNFLLQTSILARLSASLCDFVTQTQESQAMLEHLEMANLFVVPLDNRRRWYRYHHLFADLLRHRLRQTKGDRIPELHSRASRWYETNSMKDEAVEHALTGRDFERALRLIKEQIDPVWQRGEHTKMRRWLAALPVELVYTRPRLCILHAWDMFTSGHQEAAEQSLQAAEQALDPRRDRASETSSIDQARLSDSDRMEIQGKAAAIRAFLASYRGEAPAIKKYSLQALEYLPEQDVTWRSAATSALGDAYSFIGELAEAYRVRLEALKMSKAAGNFYMAVIASIKLAVTMRQQGRLKQVREICQQQLQIAKESGLSQSVVVGSLLSVCGEILAEFNDLEGAIHQAKKGAALNEGGRDLMMLGWSYLCLIRVLFTRGDISGAEETIRKMENTAREHEVPPWITNLIAAWKARIWLAQNNLRAAAQSVEQRELDTDGDIAYPHEMEYAVLARILVAQGRLAEATRLLQRLLQASETRGHMSRTIEILMLQALTFKAGGHTNRALVTLERAISLAEPKGFFRIFVDEGQPMAELLESALNADLNLPQAYVKKLLSAFRLSKWIETDTGLVEQLSERELDVLRLIAVGLSNSQIAGELFISLNTVKTHTKNINSKLNVHNRTEAVSKAREIGLL